MPGNRQAFSTAINAADRKRWDSQWAGALQEYQRALAEFPEDATARSGLGFCYMQLKQWQNALSEYTSILQHEPGNVIALSKIAELYGILNRRDDAYQAYLHLADLYAQAGQGARAEAAWQKAVQLSPGNPEPHERLASYYFEKKDISQMIQERLAAAQGYLLRNEPGPARMHCEEVLRADGTNYQAQQLLSQILAGSPLQQLGLPEGAETTFSSHRPDNGAGYSVNATNTLSSSGTEQPFTNSVSSGNTSGGNTGIMGNMGSAGNFGGVNNPSQASMPNGGMNAAPHKRITANQVTGALQQAQTFQNQGRFNDAIDLCEQILESGFDRPDARYFLGWLYQEQQRWDEAIQHFQHLLNDPDYALSCYYALGQCYRARGDLRTATVHFDEAVDRVNLDALTAEESDQLVQLCQEAAEAHRLLGEQEQALTVYNALLGFLRSRGWSEKVAQVEYMLQQAQGAPVNNHPQQPQQAPPVAPPAPPTQVAEAPTMEMNASIINNTQQPSAANPAAQSSTVGELPDWLTGILNDGEKPPAKSATPEPTPAPPVQQVQPAPPAPAPQPTAAPEPAAPSWLTDDAKPNAARTLPPDAEQLAAQQVVQQTTPAQQPSAPVQPVQPAPQPIPQPLPPQVQPMQPAAQVQQVVQQQSPIAPVAPSVQQPMVTPPAPTQNIPDLSAYPQYPQAYAQQIPQQQQQQPLMPLSVPLEEPQLIVPNTPVNIQQAHKPGFEELLNQMGNTGGLGQVADAVLASTAALPDNVRVQVVHAMQDIQKYLNHGLLTPATEECLRVIDLAPQYLDVHQVLCEIYVRQGNTEQAITKYAILVDTYIVNGRIDDAVATYRRILQLDPNNLTYRMRLINLLSSQGNKEDLLRERTMAAESYLRLGYMDRAITELEQALQESPTSVPTRLNYALALHKLGRTQQAVAEYQRVLQIDPRNLTALVRWHIAMITVLSTPRGTSLELLTRIRWQLRGEGQKQAQTVHREYMQSSEIYPNNADVRFALGQIYQQCGYYDRAIDEYMQATRDSHVEVFARVSAAQAMLSQGKPEVAIQQLEQALQEVKRAPNAIEPIVWAARPREEGEEHQAPEVEISLHLAKAYERTGRQEQAQALLRQIKQARPGQDEISSSMAEISSRHNDLNSTIQEQLDLVRYYRHNRQTENAVNALNEMVRMAPSDPRAHDELADIYINRGQLDEAMAELRLLADIHLRRGQLEDASTAIQRVGNMYAEMGDTEEALANLFRAAELNPESMDLLREVIGFCLQLGRKQDASKYQGKIARYYFDTQQVKEAVAALQQLITIDPSDYNAYDMLGQTYQSVGEYEQASRVYRNLAKVNPGSTTARERLATLQELRAR
ncbi:tetratricopeptide repeat protein [Ktedonobacteria bacterium brp13]|nr:tetratricopeptide repeat protein [Ktedonobacteria bacterium brp13]